MCDRSAPVSDLPSLCLLQNQTHSEFRKSQVTRKVICCRASISPEPSVRCNHFSNRTIGSFAVAKLSNYLVSRGGRKRKRTNKPLIRFFVLEGSEEGRCMGRGAGALTDHQGSCVKVFYHQRCTIEKMFNVF